MTPMFSIFKFAIKVDCSFLAIFQGFHLFVSFIFDKLAPPLNICFKNVLNHYLFHSSAQNSLKSAKNVVFFLFCILVDLSKGGLAPLPGYAAGPRCVQLCICWGTDVA